MTFKIVKVQKTEAQSGYIISGNDGSLSVAGFNLYKGDEDFLAKLEDGQVAQIAELAAEVARRLTKATGMDLFAALQDEMKNIPDLTTIYEVQ